MMPAHQTAAILLHVMFQIREGCDEHMYVYECMHVLA